MSMSDKKEDLGEGWLDKGVVIGSSTDEVWGANAGISILVNVHEPALCAGRHCVIHNPSNHHMRKWETHYRADLGIMERLCPDRGIGHPDPDDLAWHISQGRDWAGVHGCDGCCVPPPRGVEVPEEDEE